MDTAIISLALLQIITFILLSISEFLAISDSPYSGIIHALMESVEKKIRSDICVHDS